MQSLAHSLVGSSLGDFARRFPSYLKGSARQSRACYERPEHFEHSGSPAVLLVPGMFCTPSVMNGLGRKLDALGADVYLTPRAYPIAGGALANTCRLDESAALFMDDLARLRWEHGVERVLIVGHSNGALIPLLAFARLQPSPESIPEVLGLVSMGSPFGGSPIAKHLSWALPACKDVSPGSVSLAVISREAPRLVLSLISGQDTLVPDTKGQTLEGARQVLLDDFQHMDFIVGEDDQVSHCAGLIHEELLQRWA